MFLLSPDSEFPGNGTGMVSKILYHAVFQEYKRLLIIEWGDSHIQAIVGEMNRFVFRCPEKEKSTSTVAEDLTVQIDAAMATMDAAGLTDDENANKDTMQPLSPPNSLLTLDKNVADDGPCISSSANISEQEVTLQCLEGEAEAEAEAEVGML